MKNKQYLCGLVAFLLVTGSAYAQLYRCENGGKTAFSDTPCPSGAVQEKTEETDRAKSSSNAPGTPVPPVQDYKSKAKAADKYLRIHAIDREISDKERQIQANLHAMEVEFKKRLNESESIGVNKLNALYKKSLADEMQAIVARYRVNNEILNSQINSLRAEKNTLIESSLPDPAQTATTQPGSGLSAIADSYPYHAYRINVQIRDKESEIQGNIDLMNQEVAKKQKASDEVEHPKLNALWKLSLFDEIQAIIAKHQAINDVLQKQLDKLYEEKAKLPPSN